MGAIVIAVVSALATSCRDATGPRPATPPGQPDARSGEWVAVSAGGARTCAVDRAGQAYCWGSNFAGQLGTGDDSTRLTVPAPVAQPAGSVRAITVGFDHQCLLDQGGRAYCWGENGSGQLGVGSAGGTGGLRTATLPTPVAGGLAFRQISAGTVRTCGIATTGETYCWGAGFGPAPTAIAGGARFTQVSAGRSHQCGVTADADAYCWGDNSFGQLGTEAVPSRCAAAASAPCAAPGPVRVAGGLRFRQISAGALHSCGVTTAGAAYCWGLVTPDRSFGAAELGNAAYSNYRGAKGGSSLPVPVEGGFAFREVTAGFRGSCGVTTAGAVVCWGSNNFGQMGIGSTDPAFSTRPRMVWMPAAQGAPTLTEYDNVCALTTTGRIFCWGGYNFFGELGSSPVSKAGGPVHSRAVPTPVESPARRGHAVPASAP